MKEKYIGGDSLDFLLIGESKIKIILTEEETEIYKLDTTSSDIGGSGARRSFWQILDRARGEVGFDPAGDKVLIQMYPIKSGGCEIFVTKLGILPDSSARLVSKSNRIAMLSKKKSLYAFESLEDVISAAIAVRAVSDGAFPVSDIYESNDKYYLLIEEYGKGGEPMEFPCILEFGSGLAADIGSYITEHAVKLTEGNGIEIFSKL
jgi:negative regulator of genetic competence, sporulation and motility